MRWVKELVTMMLFFMYSGIWMFVFGVAWVLKKNKKNEGVI